MKILLGFARIALGLFGAVAFVGGVIDVLYGLVDGAPWTVLVVSLIGTLIAFAVAYAALDHFPWERRSLPRGQLR